MIKVFCDRCKKDCGRNAFDIRVGVIHNPTPMYFEDIGELTITQAKPLSGFACARGATKRWISPIHTKRKENAEFCSRPKLM